MTEEEIKALQEELASYKAKNVELETAVQTERAAKEVALRDKETVVEEIKELRQKKTELQSKVNLSEGEQDVDTLVAQALARRAEEEKKAAFNYALAEFKASKPEFQADPAGLVFSKFEQSMKKFNFSDVASKEEAKARLEEVYRFVNNKPAESGESNYEGTPSSVPSISSPAGGQSADVKKVLEQTSVDEGRFKELQEKYPDALSGLGI